MTCSVEDCQEPTKSGRCPWCNKHYRRMLKTGSTADPRAPKPCAVEGCDRNADPGRKGWCAKHWLRWHKHGDPRAVSFIVGDDVARFWSKVSKNGPVPEHCPELGPCWPWTGGCDDAGYGNFYYTAENGRSRTTAHRWLLGHLRGSPLTRDVVGEEDGCHHCDNPPCCNPAHLYVGTRKQNIADAVDRSRLWQLRKETCPQGHPLDGVTLQRSGSERRYCKACRRASQRKTRVDQRTTCKNGHPLHGDNVLLCKNGTRKCRVCDAARIAKIAERRKFVPHKGNQPKS